MQACDGCRARKTRCLRDHEDDTCTRCAKLRLSCTFDRPVKPRGPKKRSAGSRSAELESHSTNTESPIGCAHPQLLPNSPSVSVSQAREAALAASTHTSQRSAGTGLYLRGSHSCNSEAPATTPHSADAYQHEGYATDFLGPRRLVVRILDHYLMSLYPLIPVVHRPTFWRNVTTARDAWDVDFLSLEIAICAAVVGTMPSKFEACRSEYSSRSFQSRKQLMYCCYNTLIQLRGQDYFDMISYNKWATSYLMAVAFFQIGEHNRSRMIDVESMQLGRLLHMHQISEYEGLNCIETQLRKKGFWLLFYAYIHSDIQSLRKERLTYLDKDILATIDPERLLPLDLDDELIEEDRVCTLDGSPPCLTTGFIRHSRVFWAAIQDREPLTSLTVSPAAARLGARVENLKYMLDDVPPELRPWGVPSGSDDVVRSQFGSMRANLHITHLWLQSILVDQLEILIGNTPEEQEKLWQDREELSRQLLHLLHSVPQSEIEPNGLHLTYKVRDVAVGLFACPYMPHEPASQRAAIYVREFTEILSRLDASGTVNTTNLQSWVDTDRVKGPVTPGRGAVLRNENMAWP